MTIRSDLLFKNRRKMFPWRFWQGVKVRTILASFSALRKLWLPPLDHWRPRRPDGGTDEGDFESTPLVVHVWKVGGTCEPNRIQGVGSIKVVDFGLRLFRLRWAANSADLPTSVFYWQIKHDYSLGVSGRLLQNMFGNLAEGVVIPQRSLLKKSPKAVLVSSADLPLV